MRTKRHCLARTFASILRGYILFQLRTHFGNPSNRFPQLRFARRIAQTETRRRTKCTAANDTNEGIQHDVIRKIIGVVDNRFAVRLAKIRADVWENVERTVWNGNDEARDLRHQLDAHIAAFAEFIADRRAHV